MLIQLCKRCSAVASISARRVRGIVPNLYKTWSIRDWIVFYYVSDKSLISSAPVVRFAIVFSSYVEDELCDLSAVIVDAPVIPFVVRITEMTMGSSGASSWRKAEHQIRPVVLIFFRIGLLNENPTTWWDRRFLGYEISFQRRRKLHFHFDLIEELVLNDSFNRTKSP